MPAGAPEIRNHVGAGLQSVVVGAGLCEIAGKEVYSRLDVGGVVVRVIAGMLPVRAYGFKPS